MRKLIAIALVAVAIVALAAAPAFAEGYNNPTGPGDYTRATGFFSGPHGGYTTTTNKCQDCHSTHYAFGSFNLLRANSREAACDFCHGGGGGSTINIMMDNDYRTGDYDMTLVSAVETTSNGPGTGHTLGFEGNAPADIQPAYSDPEGFACFDCHSPHGNSARIVTTFANPGRSMGGVASANVASTAVGYMGNEVTVDGSINATGEWAIDALYGNLKWYDTGAQAATAKPVWPTGRFLLLKDPDAEAQADTVVATGTTVANNGVNKYAINWTDPLGPADGTYGGGQDNDNDKSYPMGATQGFLALSEVCVDCHDGTAGVSTQPAVVWQPLGVAGSNAGSYLTAYSHDAQPRH